MAEVNPPVPELVKLVPLTLYTTVAAEEYINEIKPVPNVIPRVLVVFEMNVPVVNVKLFNIMVPEVNVVILSAVKVSAESKLKLEPATLLEPKVISHPKDVPAVVISYDPPVPCRERVPVLVQVTLFERLSVPARLTAMLPVIVQPVPMQVKLPKTAVAVAVMFIVPAACPTLLITTSSPITGIAAPAVPLGLSFDQHAVLLHVNGVRFRQYLVAILKRL